MDLSGYVMFITRPRQPSNGGSKLYGSACLENLHDACHEISEINGINLDRLCAEEIKCAIKEALLSRQLQLQARKGNEDCCFSVEDSRITDIFVISIETNQQHVLDEFAAFHNVTPVDLRQLLAETASSDASFVAEELESSDGEDDSEPKPWVRHSDTCTTILEEDEEFETDSSDSIHCTDCGLTLDRFSMNGYGSYGSGIATNGSLLHNYSKENIYNSMELSNLGDDNFNHTANMNDSGPHREMPIDVPVGFKGAKKEPPRYPGIHTPQSSSTRSVPSTPQRDAQNNATPHRMTKEEELAYAERIRKYQEELNIRKEKEEKMVQQEEFLRTSLRGSKKLQALEESRAAAAIGIVNPNYIVEEEGSEAPASGTASRASTLPIRYRDDGLVRRPLEPEEIVRKLNELGEKLPEERAALVKLAAIVRHDRFSKAIRIHNRLVAMSLQGRAPTPVTSQAHQLALELPTVLSATRPGVQELCALIGSAQFKGMLAAHDGVAAKHLQMKRDRDQEEDDDKDYLYNRATQYGEESIKIVRLHKTADPLGATVRNDGESVIIGRIVKGGAAEKSGLLHEGDEILEINGTDIRGKSVNDVCDLMANMTGTLTFLIIPGQDLVKPKDLSEMLHVRAHFDYDPEDDLYIPCRELGISFVKGDIIHVIDHSGDPNWWQAYREGEEDQALAGLIPSRNFQEQRESMKQTIANENRDPQRRSGRCRCVQRRQRKKKKKGLYSPYNDDADEDEILTYEDMALFYPQPNRKRPIVLMGPPNIGRHELRQRLMEHDSDRFSGAVPHTSRSRRDDEENGADYHFVSRQEFDADIGAQKFVEFGEYEKNLYGTSLEAIRTVINSGKICVLNLHTQSLRMLKSSDLKPYIIFIAPPNMEKLKLIRQKQSTKVSDTDLKEIIERAREMEDAFGHYFDYVLVNSDLDRSFDELLKEINRLEVEPQWVPAHWVN